MAADEARDEAAAADLLALVVDACDGRVGVREGALPQPVRWIRARLGDEDGGVGRPDGVEAEMRVARPVGQGEAPDGFVAGGAGRGRAAGE